MPWHKKAVSFPTQKAASTWKMKCRLLFCIWHSGGGIFYLNRLYHWL
ncbi:hypothetical protein HMPREF9098_2479 [Kingella denitrificans ATCC 33394]|uniref:Uncharacterized protein n=1 Tax=Kingella denitrificans ATCC 33394 TaxID=888741 RepID=F0F2Z4_9NEIS|nr:hypothetical protein HMPREF9098_2479 [Kingella denitrificans ATCC 33394]